jgi:DNA-binding transcriptional MerR regulator
MSFNTKTVVKLTNLTLRQIDYWDRIHFIKPSVKEASGYGTGRLYSFEDIVQLKVAKTLIDKGDPPEDQEGDYLPQEEFSRQ